MEGICDGRKSERDCESTDEQGRSTSSCKWDFLHKNCAELDCHSYDDDRRRCHAVSYCIHGKTGGEEVCFNDDCHMYNPDAAGPSFYYSGTAPFVLPKATIMRLAYPAVTAGPQSKRAQKCKDAKHCRHFVLERNGESSWGCAWDDCKTYERSIPPALLGPPPL